LKGFEFPKVLNFGGGAVWLALDTRGVGDPFDKLRAGSSLRLKNGYAQDDNAVRGPNYATTIKFQ